MAPIKPLLYSCQRPQNLSNMSNKGLTHVYQAAISKGFIHNDVCSFFPDYTGKTQAPNEYYSNLLTRLFLCVTSSLMSNLSVTSFYRENNASVCCLR